ncbi:MAG TPA: class I SAM-dependent methyltransferase [Streptosporangiaceae bacterium]|jgi:SAM-dependent methyltransferase
MNENHARLCASPEWASYLQEELLPAVMPGGGLGLEMLEIGPGPGAATRWLRHRTERLTALESDPAAAATLAAELAGTNVTVVVGDAAQLSFPDASFDSAGTFTMLHHVPTAELQYRVLAEAYRVLRPGGVLVGSDSLASNELHHFHADDTYLPVEPATLLTRLQAIGFRRITITVDKALGFIAGKPSAADEDDGRPGAAGRPERETRS